MVPAVCAAGLSSSTGSTPVSSRGRRPRLRPRSGRFSPCVSSSSERNPQDCVRFLRVNTTRACCLAMWVCRHSCSAVLRLRRTRLAGERRRRGDLHPQRRGEGGGRPLHLLSAVRARAGDLDDLSPGSRLYARVVDVDPNGVSVGQRVRVVLRELSGSGYVPALNHASFQETWTTDGPSVSTRQSQALPGGANTLPFTASHHEATATSEQHDDVVRDEFDLMHRCLTIVRVVLAEGVTHPERPSGNLILSNGAQGADLAEPVAARLRTSCRRQGRAPAVPDRGLRHRLTLRAPFIGAGRTVQPGWS